MGITCDSPHIAEQGIADCKVNCPHYRPRCGPEVGRVIALLFHERGTRKGRVVSSMPWTYFTPGKEQVPIVQEAAWAPGLVWTGRKSRPTGIRSQDRPARSQSLYRLSYPAHQFNIYPAHSQFLIRFKWKVLTIECSGTVHKCEC